MSIAARHVINMGIKMVKKHRNTKLRIYYVQRILFARHDLTQARPQGGGGEGGSHPHRNF